MLRFAILLILIAAMAVPAWLWQRDDANHVGSSVSADSANATIAPTARPTDDRMPLPSSIAADGGPTNAASIAVDAAGTASNEASARTTSSASLRLSVHAPASVRVGDSVTITIDAEAFGGIGDLSFDVIYDDRVLEFVSSSQGSLVQQASAPATLSAEDPSTGGVLVHMSIKNGGVVAGAGTVVVLEFNAIRAGTSKITLRDVSFLEREQSGGPTSVAVQPASITVD